MTNIKVAITRAHYLTAECHSVDNCVLAKAIQEATQDKNWEVSGDGVYNQEKNVFANTPDWFDELASWADNWLTPDPKCMASGLNISEGVFDFDTATGEIGEFQETGTADLEQLWYDRLPPDERERAKRVTEEFLNREDD